MSVRGLYLVVFLLLMVWQQPCIAQQDSTQTAESAAAGAEPDTQLKINIDALFAGSSEQIRIDAATVMLFSEDDFIARKALLNTLKQSENNTARAAVCKALIGAKLADKPIPDKEDFIAPLLEILAVDSGEGAQLAAEALLAFEYDKIAKSLENIITNSTLSAEAKINAIYALKLQPDKRAILKLMDMLEGSDSFIAAQSANALISLGIPVGDDARARRQLRDELKRKGRDEFLRDWEIRQKQEKRVRKLEEELKSWQKLYLTALDRIYAGIKEDADKGNFLAEHLVNSSPTIRSWTLEKVEQWRKGTNPQLPTEIDSILVDMVSDPNRNVRLKTAKLLSLMVELNSTEKLFEQFKVEQDDEVKMAIFVALGRTCHYAFLPDSPNKIQPQIRTQTLEWAADYLSASEPQKAREGAEVIRRLLEQDGLTSDEVEKYLALLVYRYKQEIETSESALRSELLNAMAGLCAQSTNKDQAKKLFRALFEEALHDKAELVRQAAVDGLINIDQTTALKNLRENLANDSSVVIRKKLISLAEKVGGNEDLTWLADKIGSNGEGESAWRAMLRIFRDSDDTVLTDWLTKLDSENSTIKLSDEQMISFLEISHKKIGEDKPETLRDIKGRLAKFYANSGKFELAAKYLGLLRETAQSTEQKEVILADLLDVYLKWPNAEAVAALIANRLSEKDFDANDIIMRRLDSYFVNLPLAVDPNVILKKLSKIKLAEPRPKWTQQLRHWKQNNR